MKKNILIILAAIAVSCTTACSEKEQTPAPAQQTAAVNGYVKKDTDTIISGEVTEITGNRVTLALGTIAEMPAEDKPNGSEKLDRPDNIDFPDNAEMPKGMDFPSGERPDGMDFQGSENPEGMAFPNGMEMPEGGRHKNGSAIEKNGKEEVYIIPVGMTVDGLSGRSSDYSGITVGTVLTLTVNSDGIVCAAQAN